MLLFPLFGLLADRRHAHRQPANALHQRKLRLESLESRLALSTVMDVKVEATDLAGNPISEVEVGEEFLLVATVQDLRPQPTGVFAAYVDILYDSSLVAVNGPVTHATMYRNGPDGDTSAPGLIDDAGGFFAVQDCQSFPCHGDGDQELLFSVSFVALASGMVTSDVGEPNDPTPVHDTLVFGSNEPVAVEDINFIDDTLLVTAPTPADLVTDLLGDLEAIDIPIATDWRTSSIAHWRSSTREIWRKESRK
jgi:hypothetical protein